ncbi:MAG: STAS domain-containing protein [Verrucomicrobia bacterium]|nr:STAS domain-containing protein [Verrucomicrobiota bacterium]
MNVNLAFRPRLVESLKTYCRADFRADLVAGLTVGIVALPLAMAFGIACGVTPAAGIYTAVIAGFLISALGGTKVSIGGPTGAFIAILYGIYQQYGAANAAVCTMMAGVMLIAMGWAKLGTMIKFIPFPVTMGFTSGIAVVIFSTQVRDFLGLQISAAAGAVPAEFIKKLVFLAQHLGTAHGATLALAAGAFVIVRWWPARLARVVPGSIVALVAGTGLVMFFHGETTWGVATIGTKFNGIPQGLPAFALPEIHWLELPNLFRPALTIALLAAIESLLCAVVADGMVEDRHDSNQELIAQGIANVASPLFGGIAATGAIARTATNVKTGAHTPVAGIIHAGVLLLILLVAAPLARSIPLAVLSAVLVNVAINMGEWHHFARLRKWPKSDAAVFLTAFVLTVVIDLTVAVEFGLLLAAFMFIKRMADQTKVDATFELSEEEARAQSQTGREVPKGVMIYRLFGAFFFGAADKLETALQTASQLPEVLILRLREVVAIDATGINALEDMHEKLRKRGKHLVLCGPHTQPLFALDNAGFLDAVGRDNVCADMEGALARAKELLRK